MKSDPELRTTENFYVDLNLFSGAVVLEKISPIYIQFKNGLSPYIVARPNPKGPRF
jgi:hypothetical protein